MSRSKKIIKDRSFGIQADRDINIYIGDLSGILNPKTSDLTVTSVRDVHYRSDIAVELFKVGALTEDYLQRFILNSRTASELQFVMRLIRGVSFILGQNLLNEKHIMLHAINKLNTALKEKDYLSGISLINSVAAFSLNLAVGVINSHITTPLPKNISDVFQSLSNTFGVTSLVLDEGYLEAFKTPLNISVAPNVAKIEYNLFEGIVSHKIHKPSLMWDCSCDSFAIAFSTNIDNKCKIHRAKEGVIVNQFTGVPYSIMFDTVKLLSYSGSIWPPSIDTFVFLQFIKRVKEIILREGITQLIDIGTGTGIIGIYVARLIPGIKSVIFSDINEDAIAIAKYNWNQNAKKGTVSRFVIGNGISAINNEIENTGIEKTLVLCLPPYLAYPKTEEGMNLKNLTYSGLRGVELLEDVLRNYHDVGSHIIIGISSMAGIEISSIGASSQSLKKAFATEIPMRIPTVLYRPRLLKWLCDTDKIKTTNTSQHKYWHNFGIYSTFDLQTTHKDG